MVGRAKGAASDINHLLQDYTARISLAEARRLLDLNPLTPIAYVMAATRISQPIQPSMLLGKLSEKDRLQWISLGWRVTPTKRKTVN